MTATQSSAPEQQLFIASAHDATQSWRPFARLTRPNGRSGPYVFAFTNGAKGMDRGVFALVPPTTKRYRFPGIPPVLSNRLMPPSRPDYQNWLSWMGLEASDPDPFEILSRTGGRKFTDHFETFLKPEPVKGKYHAHFFIHGARYFPVRRVEEAIAALRPGDRLLTMSDFENPHDCHAVALRTSDKSRQLLGYCPGYIAYNFRELLMHPAKHNLLVQVQKINPDAPLSMRLLCRLSCDWPEGFDPCASQEFRLLESG